MSTKKSNQPQNTAKAKTRVSKAQLAELNNTLSDRNRQILNFLKTCKYAFTEQIRDVFFYESTSTTASIRATNRTMKYLKDQGLVNSTGRKIGGMGSGSTSFIWFLSEAGHKLLGIESEETFRKRVATPSIQFIRHTLSVTETYTQIAKAAREHPGTKITKIEWEPECWRTMTRGNNKKSLRPDLYLETQTGEYEDRWFIEVDLSSEDTGVVITKCNRYYEYYCAGKEQETHGVFPLVVWIVPSEQRKQLLQEALSQGVNKGKELFRVVTPEEFLNLICDT